MQKWKQICSILLCIAMWTTCLPSMAQELETAEQEPREAIRTSSGAELAQSVERGLISDLKLDGTVADEKGGGKSTVFSRQCQL